MCGVVGTFDRRGGPSPTYQELTSMLGMLRHRGPDGAGVYLDSRVGLGMARLSVVDLIGGLQPLTNEDRSLWLVCNGEVFNHRELRVELEARGHRFRTASDCEVILHVYEERDADCVHALNGQFAFGLWDRRRGRLLLARDRLGVRPLYVAERGDRLVFGSEIKALVAHPGVRRELDLVALGQVCTSWAPVPPRTMFKGISSLRPGHVLIATARGTTTRQYWRLEFPRRGDEPRLSEADAAEYLRYLMVDAARLRLRADVAVGSYLSGGLDSSVLTAIAQRCVGTGLQTFSVAFSDGEFDERGHQSRIVRSFGTTHHVVECTPGRIAQALPDVVWHAETPMVRTAPAPMYLLSRLVRSHGLKVVLSGEGADEFLLGYDIFKEAKVRGFWARHPESKMRPLLLRRLYSHIPQISRQPQAYLEAFFGQGLSLADDRSFSHALRWATTMRLHRYFSPEVRCAISRAGAYDLESLLGEQGADWDPLSRAQHIEVMTFLEPYLLSSQGDRMAMAHGVEIRHPFLDYRLVEFCNSLPPRMKMRGLNEKAILKRAVTDLVPPDVRSRTKQPFRAPIGAAFSGLTADTSATELLDPVRAATDGVFNPVAVAWLRDRLRGGARLSELDGMAAVAIASFGLFTRAFFDEFEQRSTGASLNATVVGDRRTGREDAVA